MVSDDFWAGYLSGAAGIVIGNPLDLVKVRLQTNASTPLRPGSSSNYHFESAGNLVRGVTAPILGYGALNALLFMTYNRSLALLAPSGPSTLNSDTPAPLLSTFLAGVIGGLATFFVSAPTELIKCRAQLSPTSQTSWSVARDIAKTSGLRGLYFGGVVTSLRDSVGYGFYFWSYELGKRVLGSPPVGSAATNETNVQGATRVLLCGGTAGVITWASVFPLDVIKTRLQTQNLSHSPGYSSSAEHSPLLRQPIQRGSLGAVAIARKAYREEGMRVFFRGLGVCSARAFIVNAVQWAVYEWIMRRLKTV